MLRLWADLLHLDKPSLLVRFERYPIRFSPTGPSLPKIVPLRIQVAVAGSALVAAILFEIVFAVERTPQYLLERGAAVPLIEIACACAVYAVAFMILLRKAHFNQDEFLRTAVVWGLVTGAIEVANVAIENGLLIRVRGPALQISCMLVLFACWCAAGTLVAARTGSMLRGVLAAVAIAGICALIAVAAGCLIEFFVAPPAPAYVATWQEFNRSGWSDPRAFALANTVDSGFTHLLLAPIVAALLSLAGAWIVLKSRRKSNLHPPETSG